MTQPGQRIALDGASNFRDIGGYPTTSAQRVRRGRVYRSDDPGNLTDADLDTVLALGIRKVCDLRKPSELEQTPSRLIGAPGVEVLNLAIGSDASDRPFTEQMFAGELRTFSEAEMAELYIRILREFPASFAGALRCAAQSGDYPMLVHCAAGKDRTGLVIAAILSVLGVDEAVIASDYELTEQNLREWRVREIEPKLQAVGVPYDDVSALFGSSATVLRSTFALVRNEWGSMPNYLLEYAGLSQVTLDEIRAALLESPV